MNLKRTLLNLLFAGVLGTCLAPSVFALDFGDATFDPQQTQGDISASDCANLSESLAASLGCDTQDGLVDFRNFGGTFEGPDATGYDPALTQSKDARAFIKRIINFALSFLGLIATAILIYGGGMYVLSRGDEDMASTGKKTIQYTATGILIIAGAFAFVNTLIFAGGGSPGTTPGTLATNTVLQAGESFDRNAVLRELTDMVRTYNEAYTGLLKVNQEVNALKAQEMPLIVDVVDVDFSLGGLMDAFNQWTSGQDPTYQDYYSLVDETDIEDYLNDMREGAQDIQSLVDSLSDTYEAAQALLNYLRSGVLPPTGFLPLDLLSLGEAQASTTTRDPKAGYSENPYAQNPTLAGNCFTRSYESLPDDFMDFGAMTYTKTQTEFLDDNICGILDKISEQSVNDYNEAVDNLLLRFDTVGALFGDEEGVASSSLSDLRSEFELARTRLESSKTSINNNTAREFAASIDKIYVMVETLEFVQVQMQASVTRGNAPIIVNFNVLGTQDPSGLTVTDDRIEWDLDGDGRFNTAQDGSPSGAAVSFIYQEPGTYIARVRVKSSEDSIAAGVAAIPIEVSPRRSLIVLRAETGGESTTLADFSRDNPVEFINLNSFKVTMAEAKQGITFDASDSRTGGDKALTRIDWDFGDGEVVGGDFSSNKTVTHQYGEQGVYDILLTVTDENGIQDRKPFKLFVASPAARMNYSPSKGIVGTVFQFDGRASSTDLGTIVSYEWAATLDGDDLDLPVTTGSTLNASFAKPGLHTITLSVVDSSGTRDETSVDVLVESQPPVPIFTVEAPDSSNPGLRFFDAKDTFDPDPEDELEFDWDFGGEEGRDYEIVDSNDDDTEMTVQFLEKGDYKVTLTVEDDHPSDIRRKAQTVQTIPVDSVLDVELRITGDSGRHLDENGEVDVDFVALSETGSAFTIDFGDGTIDFSDDINRGQENFTHTYSKAGVYEVKLTVEDEEQNQNIDIARVYIGTGEDPIAVINVSAINQDIGSGARLTGSVRTQFTFDAGASRNKDGTDRNLSYSWNFGDGVVSNQRVVTRIFEETAVYKVTLTVKDLNNPSLSSTTFVNVDIKGIEPEIRRITVAPAGTTNVTPLKLNVTVDAIDEDGEISFIKGWYYEPDNSAVQKGVTISQGNSFTLTVNTDGEEGDTFDIIVGVEVTDNDNQTVSSFGSAIAPEFTVENGPNKTPSAGLTVDRTSVSVGEEVTFSSTSFDPDGKILLYTFDLEGDGFFNNEPQEDSTLTYRFNQIHTEGVNVQLKVEDDAGATDVSEPIRIFVDSIAESPEAKFLATVDGLKVQFENGSLTDTQNDATLAGSFWDFDLATDSDGNGIPDDDMDSDEKNPNHTYKEEGLYRIKLTAVDSYGQTDEVENEVRVINAADPEANFSFSVDDKRVRFTNESSTDASVGVEARGYLWDFGVEGESSSLENPSFLYDEYGTYEVSLTVTDDLGQTDKITQTVELADPESFQAQLTSIPEPTPGGQIFATGSTFEVTFFYGAQGGSRNLLYQIDKNIFFDTNGDGIRDNDVDYTSTQSGTFRTSFDRSWGQIVTKLTVTDQDTGEKALESLQVVFEGTLGSVNLFNATPKDLAFLIISTLMSVTLGVMLMFRNQLSTKPIQHGRRIR